MYSTYNKDKSEDAERFTRTLSSKIYKRMTANNKKPYLGYFNELVGESNYTYHSSLKKTY